VEPEVSLPCHKSSPLLPILTKMNPVRTVPSHSSKIRFNIIPEPTIWFSLWPLSFDFSYINFAFSFLSCVDLTLLELSMLIILGEQYKSWGSLLCSFLQPSVTSFLFRTNILLNTGLVYFNIHKFSIIQEVV
jgi:hypothetical protein